MVKKPLVDSSSLRKSGHYFLMNKKNLESIHIVGVLGLSLIWVAIITLDESTPIIDENLK